MSDADDSNVQQLIAFYPRLLVENYCILASTALLWFDFTLTLTTEVRRIWHRKFSGATVVYLLTRYTALIERMFFCLEVLLWDTSTKTCAQVDRADDILTILNYFAIASFSCLRVYGVWGRDWRPLLLMVPLTVVKPILYILESTHYIPAQYGPPYGCIEDFLYSDGTLAKFSTIAKATTIASDAILIGITWYKTFGINRDSAKLGMRTPVATLLLRDGTAYFIILLLIQVVTIITSTMRSTLTVWLVWPYFDQVLTVIFLSRFMLDLRGIYFSDDPRTQAGQGTSLVLPGLSDIHFTTSAVVGNLGATLTHSNHSISSSSAASSPAQGNEERLAGHEDEEVEKMGIAPGEEQWYNDEEVEYAFDPFERGIKMPSTLDVIGTVSPPALETIELSEVAGSPTSPTSPHEASMV